MSYEDQEATNLVSQFIRKNTINVDVLSTLCELISINDIPLEQCAISHWKIVGQESGNVIAHGYNIFRQATKDQQFLLRKKLIMEAKIKCTSKGVSCNGSIHPDSLLLRNTLELLSDA